MSPAKLFQPIQVGDATLKHRVVMAPLTRFRAHANHVPGPQAETYYAQRASMPGTLLITEATFISQKAGGFDHVPGIYTDDQIAGWKKITDAVHAKGSFIYLQLWALGRAADPSILTKENNSPYVSASGIPLSGKSFIPQPLTIFEIEEYVRAYATAASNAVHKAGFDGVEIHGANGFLVDQFLQDVSNKRTDEYGGSIEKRSRFALEVVDAIAQAIGPQKTAIRLSPWSPFLDMCMENPVPTFSYLVTQLLKYPLAYVHVVEARHNGTTEFLGAASDLNDFIRDIWGDRPYISAGGYDREGALRRVEDKGGLIAFGKKYIPNPDLPFRLLKNLPLTAEDRETFYQPGNLTPSGYTDFPFAGEIVSEDKL